MKLEAVQDNNVELVTEILGDISSLKVKDDSAAELSRILQEPHFQVRRRIQTQGGVSELSLNIEYTTVLRLFWFKLPMGSLTETDNGLCCI